jgi:hypothetical protein
MRRMFAILICAAVPATAGAQDDFRHVKARVGQHLLATVDGLTASGVLTELTPRRIVVGDREFVPGPRLTIERDSGNISFTTCGSVPPLPRRWDSPQVVLEPRCLPLRPARSSGPASGSAADVERFCTKAAMFQAGTFSG